MVLICYTIYLSHTYMGHDSQNTYGALLHSFYRNFIFVC